MYPMEMVGEPPEDLRLQAVFADIKRTLSLPEVNSEYRTLALWPDYLVAAWQQVKPLVKTSRHQDGGEELRQLSIHLARNLPLPIGLSLRRIEAAGELPEHVLHTIEKFEALLPSLILNNCVLLLDWFDERELSESPFPAPDRHTSLQSEAHAV